MFYGGVLGVAMLLFWVWAIVDVARTPNGAQRSLPKFAWALVVVVFWVVGAFAWVALGRPQAAPLGFTRRDGAHPVDGSRQLSDQERERQERREYYRRMDEELDRRLEEKRREGGDPA